MAPGMDLAEVARRAVQNQRQSQESKPESLNRGEEGSTRGSNDKKAEGAPASKTSRGHHATGGGGRKRKPPNFFTTEAFEEDERAPQRDAHADGIEANRSSGDARPSSSSAYFDNAEAKQASSPSRQNPQTPMRGPFFQNEFERGSDRMRHPSHPANQNKASGPSRQSSRSRMASLETAQAHPGGSANVSAEGRASGSAAASVRESEDAQGHLAQEATIHEEPAGMSPEEARTTDDNHVNDSAPSASRHGSGNMASRFLRRRHSTGMMNKSGSEAEPSSPLAQQQPHSAGFFSRMTGNASRILADEDTDSAVNEPPPSAGGPVGADGRKTNARGWNLLRAKVHHGDEAQRKQQGSDISQGLTGHNMVSELTVGHLPVMMIKMAMDRDEHDVARVPVLLNYLKLRITDSIYPFSNAHAVFRIELQYGDGLLKWVIYRELRDFVNLHTHYRVAGLGNSVDMPSFPKTSIPYLNVLRREKGGSKELSKTEFAASQRLALETYLLKLVRAFMFRPEANRLAKFLEISAASISFAARGGATGKQGYIRLSSPSNLSRKSQNAMLPSFLTPKPEPKWLIIRESYVVVVPDPGSTEIWEVFLFDTDFHLERPKRIYRQGINSVRSALVSDDAEKGNQTDEEGQPDPEREARRQEDEKVSKTGHMSLSKAKELLKRRNSEDAPPPVGDPQDPSTTDIAITNPEEMHSTSQHTFYLHNSEHKIKLNAKSERQMDQFIASIERMSQRSPWAGANRFDSFAPIRQNVSAKWLADGRDYFWELSRAVAMAQKVIYIHDWWLSPELYLRRPPVENQQWRLDRLFQRKAQEGVKIYIILYKEVAQSFTRTDGESRPVDSQYTKNRLTELHPNIMVQRSPDNEARNLLWSHHEKLCVVDETIVFMGGFDLCFGRWDTPQHSLVDDRPEGFESIESAFTQGLKRGVDDYQVWPGKDYSNQRVSDFFLLNRPQDDMYDRTMTPRQPWHDFGVQLVGQPARDMARHFIQRWNHLLRIKHHSRLMPFLVPPADLTAADLEKYRLQGTCETQLLRSAGPWSLGTPKRIEHSIQNAYIKAIQLSEAFVYIENQYFSSSSEAENVVIENKIGDAIVSRIMRAHAEGMPWRACIIIPLTPGYPMPLDSPEAASVRMIMEAQARSIFRGDKSIFSRLRREGIDPEQHINFFSLRAWGKLQNGTMTSQDVYIHDKIMVVDDRLAIIGSANINERSQRGDRDSEVAVIIRDTDMIDSTMAGLPFKVGRFAHTMRVHLMQEHLGIDTDLLSSRGGPQASKATGTSKPAQADGFWDPEKEQEMGKIHPIKTEGHRDAYTSGKGAVVNGVKDLAEGTGQAAAGVLAQVGRKHPDKVPDEAGDAIQAGQAVVDGKAETDIINPAQTAEERLTNKRPPHLEESLPHYDGNTETRPAPADGAHDFTNGTATKESESAVESSSPGERLQADGLDLTGPAQGGTRKPSFGGSIQTESVTSEEANPARSISQSPGQDTYHFGSKKHRFSVSAQKSNTQMNLPSLPPDFTPEMFEDPLKPEFYEETWLKAAILNTEVFRKVFRCTPDDRCLTWAQFKQWDAWEKRHQKPPRDGQLHRGASEATTGLGSPGLTPPSASGETNADLNSGSDQGFTVKELEMMEKLLGNLRGNLVTFPTRFLESEAISGNHLFARDRIQPMAVYD